MVADVTDRAQELVAAVEAEGPSKGSQGRYKKSHAG
jgi:hypothetical protein